MLSSKSFSKIFGSEPEPVAGAGAGSGERNLELGQSKKVTAPQRWLLSYRYGTVNEHRQFLQISYRINLQYRYRHNITGTRILLKEYRYRNS